MGTETTTYALPDDRRARLDAQLTADIARTTDEQTTDAAVADDLRELEARGHLASNR